MDIVKWSDTSFHFTSFLVWVWLVCQPQLGRAEVFLLPWIEPRSRRLYVATSSSRSRRRRLAAGWWFVEPFKTLFMRDTVDFCESSSNLCILDKDWNTRHQSDQKASNKNDCPSIGVLYIIYIILLFIVIFWYHKVFWRLTSVCFIEKKNDMLHLHVFHVFNTIFPRWLPWIWRRWNSAFIAQCPKARCVPWQRGCGEVCPNLGRFSDFGCKLWGWWGWWRLDGEMVNQRSKKLIYLIYKKDRIILLKSIL